MACCRVLTPNKNTHPPKKKLKKKKNDNPSVKLLLPTTTRNKKHEDVKLMQKTLIQHNCQQIKKNEIQRHTINLIKKP